MARPREFNESDALGTAIHAFWKNGYQATSIRDLETATGLTTGSLYKAYGSKRNLFAHCVKKYMDEQSYLAILKSKSALPLRDALREVLDVAIESARPDARRLPGCLVSNLAAELATVDSELGNSAAMQLQNMQKAIELRIEKARDNSELEPGTDAPRLAAYIMVLLQGMLAISKSTKDIESMRSARDMALDCLR